MLNYLLNISTEKRGLNFQGDFSVGVGFFAHVFYLIVILQLFLIFVSYEEKSFFTTFPTAEYQNIFSKIYHLSTWLFLPWMALTEECICEYMGIRLYFWLARNEK